MRHRTVSISVACATCMLAASGSAQVTLIEAGHTLNKIVDSKAPLDPSQTALETMGSLGDIESIGIDPATGTLFVQLISPSGAYTSSTTDIFTVSPLGVVTPCSIGTGLGINARGTDMHFDPATGLLITPDQNATPNRIATIDSITGAVGTYSLVEDPPIFSASTFGMDFSLGTGGSDVPGGDLLFVSDAVATGIHSVSLGGSTSTTHVPVGSLPGGGDDVVIQPNGNWVWFGDSGNGIFSFSPAAPHAATATALDVQAMFVAAGLPFVYGTRASVSDSSGATYVTFSGSQGGSGIFRLNPGLTSSTLVLTVGVPSYTEGIQDLVVGPSTVTTKPGGQSLYFTVHDQVSGGEEVWEVTLPENGPGRSLCYGISCPCGNDDLGAGCANSTGVGSLLMTSGTSSALADDLVISTNQLATSAFGILFMGSASNPLTPFGDGLLCTGGSTFRWVPRQASGSTGAISHGPGLCAYTVNNLQPKFHLLPGTTWVFQSWYRDPSGPCKTGFNISNAVEVTFTP